MYNGTSHTHAYNLDLILRIQIRLIFSYTQLPQSLTLREREVMGSIFGVRVIKMA